jgi:hypothetical protein
VLEHFSQAALATRAVVRPAEVPAKGLPVFREHAGSVLGAYFLTAHLLL